MGGLHLKLKMVVKRRRVVEMPMLLVKSSSQLMVVKSWIQRSLLGNLPSRLKRKLRRPKPLLKRKLKPRQQQMQKLLVLLVKVEKVKPRQRQRPSVPQKQLKCRNGWKQPVQLPKVSRRMYLDQCPRDTLLLLLKLPGMSGGRGLDTSRQRPTVINRPLSLSFLPPTSLVPFILAMH
jgi:hypothetical protein